MRPLAPESASVWQLTQPALLKSCLPWAAVAVPSSLAEPVLSSVVAGVLLAGAADSELLSLPPQPLATATEAAAAQRASRRSTEAGRAVCMACILPERGGVRHCMLRVRQDGEVQPADRALVPPFAVMDILAEVERLRSEGLQVWSLGAGEPRAGAPAVVRRAVAERLARGEGLGYTAPAGLWELRAALAGRYASRYGLQVEPEAVTVATGSSGAFVLAFLAAFAPVIGWRSRGPATRPTATFCVRWRGGGGDRLRARAPLPADACPA